MLLQRTPEADVLESPSLWRGPALEVKKSEAELQAPKEIHHFSYNSNRVILVVTLLIAEIPFLKVSLIRIIMAVEILMVILCVVVTRNIRMGGRALAVRRKSIVLTLNPTKNNAEPPLP